MTAGPIPQGPFGTVVADPPWSFNDKGSRISPDEPRPTPLLPGEVRHYQTMPVAAISALPVRWSLADQAHLYLWCPAALLETHPWHVIASWGFEYKTMLAWRKTTKHGLLHFGAGHYFRGGVEYCLFATRGGCQALSHSERAIFDGTVGRHSAKPEPLQDLAERVSPGPRLELFARRHRDGWTAWGDGLPGT